MKKANRFKESSFFFRPKARQLASPFHIGRLHVSSSSRDRKHSTPEVLMALRWKRQRRLRGISRSGEEWSCGRWLRRQPRGPGTDCRRPEWPRGRGRGRAHSAEPRRRERARERGHRGAILHWQHSHAPAASVPSASTYLRDRVHLLQVKQN